MSNKNKKYTLLDIQNLFSKIPIIFIMTLAVVIVLISFFILETKKKNEISLVNQKNSLAFDFKRKENLNNFLKIIEEKKNEDFLKEELVLKQATNNALGYLSSNRFDKNVRFEEYLYKLENKLAINYLIFDEDYEVLYGADSLAYLSTLIFDTSKIDFRNIVLQYIFSQGKNNLQYWKDDINSTIRLSFFDTLVIDSKTYYIGSFSTVNSIKKITTKAILESLNSNSYDVWFYDLSHKNSFNYNSNKKFLYNHKVNLEKYQPYYLFEKYNFAIASINYENIQNSSEINSIDKHYNKLIFQIFTIILIVTTVLILFTYVFTNFIKNIINEYNDDLQNKTLSLEHLKNRFELAIIATNDGLWDIDFKTNKIYFSSKWLEMFGYKDDEIKTFADWFALIHNEDKKNVDSFFQEILSLNKDTFICEYRLKTKNEVFKWVLGRGKSFKDSDGLLDRMLMMSMDIDKNKKMKKELLDVEYLVEDGKIVIFKIKNDENLTFTYVSNSIKNFGYTKTELENNKISFYKLLHEDDLDMFKAAINASLNKDLSNFSLTCRIFDNADRFKWVNFRVILLKNHSGTVSSFYGYFNDITNIKLSQEELKQKVDDEVYKNRQKDKILIQQSKLAAMGEMLGNIAHQWRQPLNNVSLILQFLFDGYKSNNISQEMLEKYMEKVNKHIAFLSDTIDDFKDFYKPSKTKTKFVVKDAIESLLFMIKNQFENENIVINLNCVEEEIYSYENELKQVLLNILNNAKDALVLKKQSVDFEAFINLDVSKTKDGIKISIFNNADTIPTDIIDRIFEPYFTTKFENQGTGIGLYMTKSIIESNMNGKIEVQNLNDGVCFTIFLKNEDIL